MRRSTPHALCLLAAMTAVACATTEKHPTGVTQGGYTYTLDFATLLLNPGDARLVGCYRRAKPSEPAETLTCQWTSGAPDVASVTNGGGGNGSFGNLRALKPGTSVLTAKFPENAPSQTATVIVVPFDLYILPASATVTAGATAAYVLEYNTPSGSKVSLGRTEPVEWRVGASSIAQIVSAEGGFATIRGLTPGTTSVTATYTAVGGGTASASMTVTSAPLTVTTNASTYTMMTGSSVLILVTTRDAGGAVIPSPTLTFSTNPSLAILSSTATSVVVRGLAPGTYQFTITATASGQTGSTTVTLIVT